MMKMDFKKNYKKLVVAIVVGTLFVPMATFAATGDNATTKARFEENRAAKIGQDICQKIDTISKRAVLDEKYNQILAKQQTREQNIKKRLDEYDANREKREKTWSEYRNKLYLKLEKTAKTDAQKQAFNQFKTAVEAAVRTRNQTIENARDEYRKGVEKVSQDRKSAVQSAVDAYKKDVQTAIDTAKSSCSASGAGLQVATQLKSDLKAAREELKADIKEIDVKEEMVALRDSRKAAIKNAITTFKASMEKAKTDYKAVK